MSVVRAENYYNFKFYLNIPSTLDDEQLSFYLLIHEENLKLEIDITGIKYRGGGGSKKVFHLAFDSRQNKATKTVLLQMDQKDRLKLLKNTCVAIMYKPDTAHTHQSSIENEVFWSKYMTIKGFLTCQSKMGTIEVQYRDEVVTAVPVICSVDFAWHISNNMHIVEKNKVIDEILTRPIIFRSESVGNLRDFLSPFTMDLARLKQVRHEAIANDSVNLVLDARFEGRVGLRIILFDFAQAPVGPYQKYAWVKLSQWPSYFDDEANWPILTTNQIDWQLVEQKTKNAYVIADV